MRAGTAPALRPRLVPLRLLLVPMLDPAPRILEAREHGRAFKASAPPAGLADPPGRGEVGDGPGAASEPAPPVAGRQGARP